MAEVEAAEPLVIAGFAGGAAGQLFLFQHVFTDDAPVHDAGKDQAGNVVIAHA